MSVQTSNFDSNPYSMPRQVAKAQDTGAAQPLFSLTQVAVATFFGSVAAGATLMAVNFLKMQKTKEAIVTMAVGLLGLVAVIAGSLALTRIDASSLRMIIVIAQVLGVKYFSSKMFEKEYSQEDFQSSSNWAVLGVALLWIGIIAGIAVALLMAVAL